MNNHNRKTWSASEIDYLRRHYRELGAKAIANKLGRTKASITSKATALKIQKPFWGDKERRLICNYWPTNTAAFIAEKLGVPTHRVNNWIQYHKVRKSL